MQIHPPFPRFLTPEKYAMRDAKGTLVCEPGRPSTWRGLSHLALPSRASHTLCFLPCKKKKKKEEAETISNPSIPVAEHFRGADYRLGRRLHSAPPRCWKIARTTNKERVLSPHSPTPISTPPPPPSLGAFAGSPEMGELFHA